MVALKNNFASIVLFISIENPKNILLNQPLLYFFITETNISLNPETLYIITFYYSEFDYIASLPHYKISLKLRSSLFSLKNYPLSSLLEI